MCILGPCNYNDWLENLRTSCRPGLALSDWLGAFVFVLMWMCSHTSATDTGQKCRLAVPEDIQYVTHGIAILAPAGLWLVTDDMATPE
jgi:hypothetical protein